MIADSIRYGVIHFNWSHCLLAFEKKPIFYLNSDKWIIICSSYEPVRMMNYKLILNPCDRLELPARLWYIYVGSDSINHYRDFDDIPVILFWNITFFSWQLDIIITRCVHKLSRERGKDNKHDFIATWILETPLTPSDALIVWTKDAAVVVFLCKCMSLIAPCSGV